MRRWGNLVRQVIELRFIPCAGQRWDRLATARRAGSQAARKATAAIRNTMRAESDRIPRADSEEQAVQQTGGGERTDQSDRDADRDQHHRLADDEPEDGRLRRAERDADADLVGPLRDRVGHHAVNADGGEKERGPGEDGKKQGVETRPGERTRDVILKDSYTR